MALDILNDNWGPYTHTEVENALKAYLTVLEDRINQAIQSGGVGLADLSQEVRTLLAKANTALQPENIAAWARAQNKPGYNVSEITYSNLLTLAEKLADMDQKIQEAAASGGVDPDDEMSSTSENVVQNKVIKAYVDAAVLTLQNALNALMNGQSVTDAIDTFNEIKAFLEGIDTDDPTLFNQLKSLSDAITALQTTLSQKANDNAVVKSISVNGTAQTKDGNGNVNVSVPTLTLDEAPTAGSDNAVKSKGIKTAIDNVTPTISQNGKWVIGGVESEVDAQGPRGNSILVNENAQGIQALLVNNVSDGGDTDILTAEMGKVLRIAITTIYNALGAYAFPNGKPILSWGSTIIRHNINTDGVTGGLTITDVEVDGTSEVSLPAQIMDNKSLSLKLTPPSGKSVKDDSVAITMGGVDITNDVYTASTDTIDIPAVTGDIVIAATSVNYDAEIEYIQSSGTQWIDTGIVAGAGFKCEIKADVQAADTAWHRLLAARDANATFAVAVGLRPTNESGCLYAQFGQAPNTGITFNLQQVTGLHTIITELTGTALSIKVDGVDGSVTQATSSLSFPNLSLYMFSNHRQDSTIESISAKVYYCKIWNGSDLLFDAIPVRVGQVGYMYDRVSGELLGNIGTGSFTLGNDLTV